MVTTLAAVAFIALTVRIVLSILVFALLMGSYYFGLIPGKPG